MELGAHVTEHHNEWYDKILLYLEKEILPENKEAARVLKTNSIQF